jgi:hypothetical protein
MLAKVCDTHTTNSSTNYISDLVLQQCSMNGGMLLDLELKRIEPYMQCFRKVFFGTEAKVGGYCANMTANHAGFRDKNVVLGLAAAAQLATRYGSTHQFEFGWYITHEGWIDYFGEGCKDLHTGEAFSATAVTAAYADFVGRLSSGLVAIKRATVLWSPSVGPHYSSAGYNGNWTELRLGWASFLSKTGPAFSKLVVQDAVGKGTRLIDATPGNATLLVTEHCDTVVARVQELQAAAESVSFSSGADATVEINMEHFYRPHSGSGCVAGDPFELERRAACYDSHGMKLHASWELRWWFASLYTHIPYANAKTITKPSAGTEVGL